LDQFFSDSGIRVITNPGNLLAGQQEKKKKLMVFFK
jgi:hypothetical protein